MSVARLPTAAPPTGTGVAVGLAAVVAAVRVGELAVLTVRAEGVAALPSGAFDPAGPPTFELALRGFVGAQTGFDLGYVEQLYTFGDRSRAAPVADLGEEAQPGARVISIGYLGLTPAALDTRAGAWTPWTRFFPWEDWRHGRPAAHTALELPLRAWAAARPDRAGRVAALFALDGLRWNEERVLERYELLYEAGLAAEAARDRGHATPTVEDVAGVGAPMASDHRRILATGLGRLRGKLKYRPIVFELMAPSFTLSELQRTVEAISGVALHKPNFRRMLDRTGLVEELGEMDQATGGRPARRFRFRRAEAALVPAVGFSLPLAREG